MRLYGKEHRNVALKRHDTNEILRYIAQTGDRFTVRINFKDKDIKLWYNDEFINSCYKDGIPDSVVAAASIHGGGITVIRTDYQ